MRREDVVSLFLYMVIVAVAVVFGLAVLQPHFQNSSFSTGILYALFILGAVVSSILICALIFELGHILGAKIGGYKILSVCIMHILFYKDNGKLKVKFSNFDGLTGETKILPKSEKANPHSYLIFGTLIASLFSVVCFILFYVNKDFEGFRGDVGYFLLSMSVVGFICVFYNVIPFKLDSLNDGYRLAMTSNPKNREAFNELLRVEYEISQGNNDVEIKTFTELTNFTASLNMNKLYIALDKEDYQEALDLVEIVLNNQKTVSHKVYLRAFAMKIFLIYINKGVEEGNNFALQNVKMETKKEIFDDRRSLISVRAYLLIEGLADNSKSECLLALGNVNAAYKATRKDRKLSESKMYNTVIDMINEAHPKWNFQDFKLVFDEDKSK